MRRSLEAKETVGSRRVAYTILLFSFLLTGLIFYALYSALYPYLLLPEPTTPPMVPVDGGPVVPTPWYTIYVNILILWIKSRTVLFYFFLIFLVVTFLNELSYVPLGYYHGRLDRGREQPFSSTPSVSIIVPAYNEEKVIKDTITSLLEVNYPDKEIIVVNDGSTDGTERVVAPFAERGDVRLINRPNGGKAAALNTGLFFARGEVIVTIDADVAVERGSVAELAPHFSDPDVVAVAGNVKVGNRVNVLTKLQALEYIRGINLRRRAFDVLNTILVAPGSISAFRKSAYERVGAYDRGTVTEDMDTTVKLTKTRNALRYEPSAVGHTEAPEGLRGLIRQRRRWYGGTLQTTLKHRVSWWRFGTLSSIGFPYLVMSMFFLPIAELTALILAIVYLASGLYLGVFYAFLAVLAIEFVLSALAIHMDGEDWGLLWYTPIYVLVYRYILDGIRLKTYWDLLRGKLKWAPSERLGRLPEKIRAR